MTRYFLSKDNELLLEMNNGNGNEMVLQIDNDPHNTMSKIGTVLKDRFKTSLKRLEIVSKTLKHKTFLRRF